MRPNPSRMGTFISKSHNCGVRRPARRTALYGPARVVVAEGRVLFPVRRISAEAYPAFRALMIEVDRAFGRRVRVEPSGTGSGPT